jgi:Cation transporter/ATPase, N-terminus
MSERAIELKAGLNERAASRSAEHLAGLTAMEAAERLRLDGPNVLLSAHGQSVARQLLGQFTHFLRDDAVGNRSARLRRREAAVGDRDGRRCRTKPRSSAVRQPFVSNAVCSRKQPTTDLSISAGQDCVPIDINYIRQRGKSSSSTSTSNPLRMSPSAPPAVRMDPFVR